MVHSISKFLYRKFIGHRNSSGSWIYITKLSLSLFIFIICCFPIQISSGNIYSFETKSFTQYRFIIFSWNPRKYRIRSTYGIVARIDAAIPFQNLFQFQKHHKHLQILNFL